MAATARRPIPASSPAPQTMPVARPSLPTFDRLEPYLRRIDVNRWYANLGPLVLELEARLAARFVRPTQVVTTANGTQAITVALRASGATSGLCAMPAWTFVATPHAAIQAGLTPWFLDVDPQTWMIDPDGVQAALARAPGPVAAVVPVAAFGRPVDLSAWAAFRERTGLRVVVDGAAAFDTLDSAPVPVTVSLHATKALGVGEGGFVASEDPAFARRVREETNFGFRAPRLSETLGTNAKLSEYAAAVGLAGLDAWPNTRRRLLSAAQRLRVALLQTSIRFQPGWGTSWVSTTCLVRLPGSDAKAITAALANAGVEARAWWGEGCHRHPAFAQVSAEPLRVTDTLAASTLGLPFASDLSMQDAGRIAAALLDAQKSLAA